ncbi:MAG TPA: DUF374 domain-containing protein [Acidobacteriaceae bacterium]|nr:DUF374 domain-containing protein [Acidobacteriaceae bacterium]
MHAFTRKQRFLLAIIPPIAALLIRALGATLRYRDITAPNTPVGIDIPGPTIFAFWHRTLLISAHRFRDKQIAILISPSFDGELIARTVALLGFHPIRGSSSRGGASGLRAMAQAYAAGHICAFTADGPRGPNMVAKPGPVQLAQLSEGTWIGAYHALPNHRWELNSWDRFIIPKPFSTVTFIWPAHVPPDLAAMQHALDEAVRMSN